MTRYIEDMVKKFDCVGQTAMYPHTLSLTSTQRDDSLTTPVDQSKYLSLLMSMMWVATHTRADILFDCSFKATVAKSPTVGDYDDAMRILKYLNRTKDYKLYVNPSELKLSMSCDASYRLHPDLRSHSGYLIQLNDCGFIIVKSKKQKTLATSSAHAELNCIQEAIDDLDFCSQTMEFFGYPQSFITVQQDNRAAILVSVTGDSKSGRLKHLLTKQYRVHEAVNQGLINIVDTRSGVIKADALTKPKQGKPFHRFVKDIQNLP